jgi:predicted transcriptional regulator
MQEALSGVSVSQAMTHDCTEIPALTPISQLVEERILSSGQRCFYVAGQEGLRGMLTLRDVTNVPQPKWRFTTAEQVMEPLKRLVFVTPETGLLQAIQVMDNADVTQAPVLQDGVLVGSLSREQVVRYLRPRSEAGI